MYAPNWRMDFSALLAVVSDSDQKENLLILLKQAGQSDSSLTGIKKWLQRILAALRIYIYSTYANCPIVLQNNKNNFHCSFI